MCDANIWDAEFDAWTGQILQRSYSIMSEGKGWVFLDLSWPAVCAGYFTTLVTGQQV